jgi:hypothetical protein
MISHYLYIHKLYWKKLPNIHHIYNVFKFRGTFPTFSNNSISTMVMARANPPPKNVLIENNDKGGTGVDLWAEA